MKTEALLQKLRAFCAYRERCTKEVREKLRRLGAEEDQQATILQALSRDGFLDDQRFARLFVRSKFEHNGWGKVRIRAALRERQVDSQQVDAALDEIIEEDYLASIHKLTAKKAEELLAGRKTGVRIKVAAYLGQKGFESPLVWQAIEDYANKKTLP